ncbi:MAG: RnfABCDGE type electron transport complex subunit D [Chlorobi bacterium]|nr:RnfABCDGE type electron transport complex subunit D [Chlorobiota bacterium]
MDKKLLTVSLSPHLHGKETTSKLMTGVVVALIPAWLVSVYFFGWDAVIVPVVSIGSSVLFEFLIQKYLLGKKSSIQDGSAIVTGFLLAMTLPSNISPWLVILGALVAIGVGKMSFGGLGNNPFNPALVGRVFLFISFPVQLTRYPNPNHIIISDAVSGATPLGLLKEGMRNGEAVSGLLDQVPSHMQMFIGAMSGSMGEIAAAAILLGFIYLLVKKIITWHIPVTILTTVFLFAGILWLANPRNNADPLFHLLTGGLMLGSVFMATDYVTSPMSKKGMIYYGIGIGLITVIIRRYGAYPEGVQFAILIMNAFVPIINMYIKPKRFGEVKKNG